MFLLPPSDASVAPNDDPLLVASRQSVASPPVPTNAWDSPIAATAMAVSALVLSEQHGGELGDVGESMAIDSAYQGDLSELLVSSMHWLARRQSDDGSWGLGGEDSSNLETTLLVRAAFQLTGVPAAYPELTERAHAFIEAQGGLEALKSFNGRPNSATLMVRGCYALAEVVDWKQLPTVPIETAPLSAVSSLSDFWSERGTALPAIIALGLASCQLHPSRNPLTRWRRASAVRPALQWLARQQADNGDFKGSIPVTSLVIMSLASIGQTSTQLVRRGVEFLFSTVGTDGSWPADSQPDWK